MEDRDEELLRRTLGRRPPPRPGPTLADDVLRSVAAARRHPAAAAGGARRRLAVSTWLLTGAACIAVLARLESSSGTPAVAWAVAMALVPVSYSATLWPGRLRGFLALCGGAVLGDPRDDSRPDRDVRQQST